MPLRAPESSVPGKGEESISAIGRIETETNAICKRHRASEKQPNTHCNSKIGTLLLS